MNEIILLFCLAYALCSFLYARRKMISQASWQQGLFVLAVCLALPFGGLPLLLFLEWYQNRFGRKDMIDLYMEHSFSDEDLRLLQTPDPEKELNQVPVEDALNLNDYSYRRNMILQLLNEENLLPYLEVLQEALGNEDTETTHYASTIIMELQQKIQNQLIEKELLYRQKPDDSGLALEWEGLLYRVLQSSLYEAHTLRRYYKKYYSVSDALLAGKHPPEQLYSHRISLLFRQNSLPEARSFCLRYLQQYPASEEAVRLTLNYYIMAKDADGLEAFLDRLHELPVTLTQETLQYIHLFREY